MRHRTPVRWLNEDGLPRTAHRWQHTFTQANARIATLGLSGFRATPHMLRDSCALRWFAVGRLGFLKSRRDRLNPRDLGLHDGPRRRVAGLLRDEVANLAGASVDYYAQLEQGRGAQPLEQMLAALARALHLSLDERNHL